MPNGNEWNGGSGQGREPDEERPLRWEPDKDQEPSQASGPTPPPPPPPSKPPPYERPWGEPDEPDEPLPPEAALPSWERLDEEGFFRALFLSIKEVLFEPGPTFARMPLTPDLARPLLFLVLLGTLGAIFTTFYVWIRHFLPLEILEAFPSPEDSFQRLFGQMGYGEFGGSTERMTGRKLVLFQTCIVLMMPVLLIVQAFIWSGVVHLMLMLFGAANHGYETTFRTICYVNGATAIFAIIPICGQPIGGVWGIVCTIIGLIHTQKASGGQAAAAVLVPLGLCCFCAIAVFMLLGIAGALAGM